MRLAPWLALLAPACHHGSPAGPSDAALVDTMPDAPRLLPVLQATTELCKLLSNANTSDPTPNDVQFRSNVLGADLGISVDDAGKFYLLFGDTIGFAGIWGGGQSHPDSVGYALDPASAIAANPALLCSDLQILSLPAAQSIGPTVDPRVMADFAGAAMTAPAGQTLAQYIHNPSGTTTMSFPSLPGDFEVPSGAFAYNGAIYVFYTTVASRADPTMKGSYLARWTSPVTSGVPSYQILYGIDERFDGAGPLGGDFINIAAVASGDYVYLFGTGAYRASPVHLARTALATLDTGGAIERFDAATRTWTSSAGAPIIATAGHGETSVRYYAAIDRWMFLAEQLTADGNRIVARFADRAEGPWSDAIVVSDMADAAFRTRYCCAVDNACQGVQFLNCDQTGFYGSYLLPDVAVAADGSFTVTFTLSSFSPYNVALFQATFR